MRKVLPFFLFTIFLLSLFVTTVHAQDIGLEVGGKTLGDASGLGHVDAQTTAVQIINVILGLLGIITVSLMVYAGFKWMTAAGNGEQIEEAQKTMKAAVLGLIIIMSAWSITAFVLPQVYRATTSNEVQVF